MVVDIISKEKNEELLREAFEILGLQKQDEIVPQTRYEGLLRLSKEEREPAIYLLAYSLLFEDGEMSNILGLPAFVAITSLTQASVCLKYMHNELVANHSEMLAGPDQLSLQLICSMVLDNMATMISKENE